MNQEIFTRLSEMLRSVMTPEMLFDIFLIVICPVIFVSVIRILFRFADPFYLHRRRVRHVWKETEAGAEAGAEAEAEAKVACMFHCDCEDCISYESGKYCPRCDRYQMCAYCSAREHCDL